ncbi:hypothetical protein [Sediminicoccus rosea]|uniref:Uncharacterized protein n=1 Tax=Sediminicoccus rosea TaxID=1225128 RepID=A0ABZ0PEK5_9PROT|nr:hypothetical protein [Sediminicoccus rosea]WPB84050.1 hypothetical protein R9Z33_18340 [Sediminicoccus rosea]
MSGNALISFIGFYVPALVAGVLFRWLKPAWGWTPLWLAVILTAAVFFVQKL